MQCILCIVSLVQSGIAVHFRAEDVWEMAEGWIERGLGDTEKAKIFGTH